MKQPGSFWLLLTVGVSITAAITWFVGPALFALSTGNAHNYSVPSVSMAPTLIPGDRFYAEQIDADKIRRGDVIVFRTQMQGVVWVMRVAALPGDKIELRSGNVVLNGVAIRQAVVSKTPIEQGGRKIEQTRLREQFPGEAGVHEILNEGNGTGDNFPAIKLPADHYFVLGDNRDNAADSRFSSGLMGAGLIASERITGHATTIYASKDPARIGKQIR